MDLKELKKLAAACRKAGISHFKSADYEFTLTEETPVSTYKQKQVSKVTTAPDAKFESDSLTDSDLLFWSVGSSAEILGTEDKN